MSNPNVPAVLSDEELKQKLAAHGGFLNTNIGSTDFHRITAKGNNLIYNKDIIASYNLKTKEPALIVKLADMPVEYQSMWFGKELARAVGRDGTVEGVPDISNRFCKSHFDDPNEARKYAEDGTSCTTCPVNPYRDPASLPTEAKQQDGASKCSWKADIEFQILDRNEDGTYNSEDQTIYTMSLPTTGIIEFKGSSSRKANPMEGSVSAEHFMVQLAKLGFAKWGDDGLAKAHAALTSGGVIAELHIPMATTQDGSKNYSVVSFKPIDIMDPEEQTALPDKSAKDVPALETSDVGAVEDDDVPF
jgi:hypothetical protein